MNIREYVPLAPLTTFKIGGVARYFSLVTDSADISEAYAFAKEHALPVFVLGGGSNVLIDDDGYPGLVLKVNIQGISFLPDGDDALVTVGAGMRWDEFVSRAVAEEYSGAENLSLIPGTIGGAVVQNIGAYGCEVKEIVEWVEIYDVARGALRTLKKNECMFGYRESIFKQEGQSHVVTRVQFRLRNHATLNIAYKDIEAYFLTRGIAHPSIHDVRTAVIFIRTEKFPILDTYGTAGSFFKNPVVTTAVAQQFIQKYPTSPHHEVGEGLVKLSAAWIIDNILHMRGVRDGNVGCWSEQALVIVNYGGASSEEIKNFVRVIQKKCFEATHITLEREVIFVNAKK